MATAEQRLKETMKKEMKDSMKKQRHSEAQFSSMNNQLGYTPVLTGYSPVLISTSSGVISNPRGIIVGGHPNLIVGGHPNLIVGGHPNLIVGVHPGFLQQRLVVVNGFPMVSSYGIECQSSSKKEKTCRVENCYKDHRYHECGWCRIHDSDHDPSKCVNRR